MYSNKQIKKARKYLRLTAAELGKAAGIEGTDNALKTLIFRIESGKHGVDFRKVDKINTFLSECIESYFEV